MSNSIPDRVQPPPPPISVEGETEYEIDRILDKKISRNRLKFLVRWKGYTAEHDEWIDEGYLEHSKDLIDDYNERASMKPNKKSRRS